MAKNASDTNDTPQLAVLTFGYQKFIMEAEAATQLFLRLRNVETLEEKWESNINGTRAIVKPADGDAIKLEYLAPEKYAMGKFNYAASQNTK